MTMNEKTKKVQWILAVILVANMAVATIKIIFGTLIQSTSMTADGFHSLTDGTSNIIGLISVRLAGTPNDPSHPYGHEKIETLSSLVIAAFLLSIGIKVVKEAIVAFQQPHIINVTTSSLVVMLLTLATNIFVTTYERRKGNELGSSFLIADASHTASDIFVTIGVLIGLVGVKLGLPPVIDPIISLVVAGFIFHAAWEIFYDNSHVLIDGKALEEEDIRQCAAVFPDVKEIHEIRSRGTKDAPYVDMHIKVDSSLCISEAHNLSHLIELCIKEKLAPNASVIVHVEPLDDDEFPDGH